MASGVRVAVALLLLAPATAAAQDGGSADGGSADGDTADVDSAGDEVAETEEEAVPTPPPDVELRPSSVAFEAPGVEGLQVLYLPDPVLDEDGAGGLVVQRPAAPAYRELCVAPCRVDLPQSHYGLAVRHGENLERFAEPLGIDGPTRVELGYESFEGERLAGILLIAIGVPVGLALGASLAAWDYATHDEIGVPGAIGIVSGASVLGASLALGLVFNFVLEDAWGFRVVPLPADQPGVYSTEF